VTRQIVQNHKEEIYHETQYRSLVSVDHSGSSKRVGHDRESHIGKLDKGLDEAHDKGWTVVDMKRDWSVVYPGDMQADDSQEADGNIRR
jgi:hypothetical protein